MLLCISEAAADTKPIVYRAVLVRRRKERVEPSPTTRNPSASPNLVHDTEIGAYLLEPARRAYPFREPSESVAQHRHPDTTRPPPTRCSTSALAKWQSKRSSGRGLIDLLDEVELPIVRILRKMEQAGLEARHRAAAGHLRARQGGGRQPRTGDLRLSPARSSRSARPSSSRRSCSESSACPRKRRGKTGYSTDARVLQAIRDEHPVIPKIERWRELTKLAQTYLDALPGADRPRRPSAHDVQPDRRDHRPAPASNNPNLQNIPIRTALGREIRACFVAEPGNLLASAPTTRRSSSGCSPTSPARTCSRRSSAAGRGRAHRHGLPRVQRRRRTRSIPGCARSRR